MEENFFHNHPASMKRVVDFVADRTASNFIKKFRAMLLPQSLVVGKEQVMKQLTTLPEGSPSSKMKVGREITPSPISILTTVKSPGKTSFRVFFLFICPF